ncbi:hypothetical protein FYJ24_00095 [Actinomycetaceae bacterium WB03_NA08]|uniref:Uncharacterized protein n=1 Tax=Scrofimicrobium canadense TaxID=2652290 RepID=A0A6N7W3V3_9ACTO|nr:hypothetical protein [Scrofimicrobium canadense]MSS83193.1 hypothetical protein [Scrofimicrobium canadense]
MTHPINKGGEEGPSRRLPQINNRLTIAALGAGAKLTKKLRKYLRTPEYPGQEGRFRAHILRALRAPSVAALAKQVDGIDASVDIRQAFGKPTLVSVDLILSDPHDHLTLQQNNSGVLLEDLLDNTVETIWNNPEIVPAAVRGRILVRGVDGADRVLIDMTALGFDDEIGRPADLYDRFGAPASDPAWRP